VIAENKGHNVYRSCTKILQGGSNMTGSVYTCLHTNHSRSYLNHLVQEFILTILKTKKKWHLLINLTNVRPIRYWLGNTERTNNTVDHHVTIKDGDKENYKIIVTCGRMLTFKCRNL